MKTQFLTLLMLGLILSGCGSKNDNGIAAIAVDDPNRVQVLNTLINDEKIEILNLDRPASFELNTEYKIENCKGGVQTQIVFNERERLYFVSNILSGQAGCMTSNYSEKYKISLNKMERPFNFYSLKNFEIIDSRMVERVLFRGSEFYRLKMNGNDWGQSYFFNTYNKNIVFPFRYLLEDKDTSIYSEISQIENSSNNWAAIKNGYPLSTDIIELVESFIYEHGN